MKKSRLYLIAALLLILFSCKRDQYYLSDNAKLRFSVDTVMFDTVFSSIGSSTKHFKVYNNYSKSLNISSIKLAKGNSSNYRININGRTENSLVDYTLAPSDSIYIFVEVTVNPGRDEMIELDSVVFETNGNIQDVDLVAFGQDVNLINSSIINSQIWTNEKPYLVYNSVAIDENQQLTIEEGTQIYFHRGSTLYVLGNLTVNGTFEEPVIFTSDRLEEGYEDVPGQWEGIWLSKLSSDNYINYAEIRNANIGIIVDSTQNNNPMLSIHNTKIEHHTFYGILTRISSVFATNCIIADCGIHALALTRGGEYYFYHSTIANYWYNSIRNTGSVLIQNWYQHSDGQIFIYDQNAAYFGNCIIWGNLNTELTLSQSNGAVFNYNFDNCILKIDPDGQINVDDTDHFLNNLINSDPSFVDYYNFNYNLNQNSHGINSADINITNQYPALLNLDLNTTNRLSDNAPDIGAYEYSNNKSQN